MVGQAVYIVLSIFLMIGMGVFLAMLRWLNDGNAPLISKLVVMVALPAMIVSNLFTKFTRETMLESLPGLIIPIISIMITSATALVAIRVSKIPKERRGVLICMMTFSNSIFIGLPVSRALFGESALIYTLMYYIANTVLFWTAGVAAMRRDSGFAPERGDVRILPKYLRERFRFLLKKADNPDADPSLAPGRIAFASVQRAVPLPLIVFFICMSLVLLGVRMSADHPILSASGYIGGMVTPLSLFFIGILLTRMLRKRSFRWERGYGWVLIGRFVISPLAVWALSLVFPVSELTRNVFIMQAAMPVMSQTSIVAESVHADSEYAAGGTAISTLISLAVIPLYMAIL